MTGRFQSSKRVTVILVGLSVYDEPPSHLASSHSRFRDLPGVEQDIDRLTVLFKSQSYRELQYSVRRVPNGSFGALLDGLRAITQELSQKPPTDILLFWAGHGAVAINSPVLRLAGTNSFDPMMAADGLDPGSLVDQLTSVGASRIGLVIDACCAAAASASVLTAAGSFLHSQLSAQMKGLTAVFSSGPYQLAEDGRFGRALERVLREGPSQLARQRMIEDGWPGSVHNKSLSLADIGEILSLEFELMAPSHPDLQRPYTSLQGAQLRIFPNPEFSANARDLSLGEAHRRWMRREDFNEHFLPKARGLDPGEEGWHFAGRVAASRTALSWLNDEHPGAPGFFCVLGSAGTGKSAFIGRLVAFSDETFRAHDSSISSQDPSTVPSAGAIDAALNLRRLDASDVARILSELMGLPPPGADRTLVRWTQQAADSWSGRTRPVVAFDSLDESSDATSILAELLIPLANRGWRFLCGSRPLEALRQELPDARILDLDSEDSAEEDIASYVFQRLRAAPLRSAESTPEHELSIAQRIASLASGRFLFARLALAGLNFDRALPQADELETHIGASIGQAFARILAKLDIEHEVQLGGQRAASSLFQALAFARGNGLPRHDLIWASAAGMIAGRSDPWPFETLAWLGREAGSFLVESGDGDQVVYRLFHESLNEQLRPADSARSFERQISSAWLASLDAQGGWPSANRYLVRFLPSHLAAAGDERALRGVCTNASYLARTLELFGSDGLVTILEERTQNQRRPPIRAVCEAVQRARVILGNDPMQLAAQLGARLKPSHGAAIAALLGRLDKIAPAIWLRSRNASLHSLAYLESNMPLEGRPRAVAFGSIDGEPILVIGVEDRVVVWDPRTAKPVRSFRPVPGCAIEGVAIVPCDGRSRLVAVSASDRLAVVLDARTGELVLQGEWSWGSRIVAGRLSGKPALAAKLESGPSTVHCIDVDMLRELQFTPFKSVAIGQLEGELVAVPESDRDFKIVRLSDGQPAVQQTFRIAPGTSILSVDTFQKRCYVSMQRASESRIELFDVVARANRPAARFDFPVQAVAMAELQASLVVCAINQTDVDRGIVAIRQPGSMFKIFNRARRPLNVPAAVGVGYVEQRPRAGSQRTSPEPLQFVLLSYARGAVDPLLDRVVSGGPADLRKIRVVHGDWQPRQVALERPTLVDTMGTIELSPDRPLTWPTTCEAWENVAGHHWHARGSYGGSVWVHDIDAGTMLGGPYRTDIVLREVLPRVLAEGERRPELQPCDGVALGTWRGRAVVARAHAGRAQVFDALSGAEHQVTPLGRVRNVVAVSLDEHRGIPVLGIGDQDGRVELWHGTEQRALASITLDNAIEHVWLCDGMVGVQTVDGQFHLFDLIFKI